MAGELLTIKEPVEHELVIRKSRFITNLFPVGSIEQADAALAGIRKRFWDANHHCTAMIVDNQQRSSDAGEPSGTAGVPMLEVLHRREMTDVLAVVTRYFGGVLLGAGGLVRAYSSSVAQALDCAQVLRRVTMLQIFVDAPIADAGRLEHVLRTWADANGGRFEGVAYDAEARITLLIPPEKREDLGDALGRSGGPAPQADPAEVTIDV